MLPYDSMTRLALRQLRLRLSNNVANSSGTPSIQREMVRGRSKRLLTRLTGVLVIPSARLSAETACDRVDDGLHLPELLLELLLEPLRGSGLAVRVDLAYRLSCNMDRFLVFTCEVMREVRAP